MNYNSECNSYENYALIDLDAIRHNYFAIKKWTNVDVLPVLKANAYGHGLEQIAKTLFECGANLFAVANLIEARLLKKSLPECDVLVLGNINPLSLTEAIDYGMILTVYSKEYWEILKHHLDKKIRIQIKINTGFNRLGFDINNESIRLIREIFSHKNIKIEGIYSHLKLASIESDREQNEKFCALIAELEAYGVDCGKKHIADSISAIDYDYCRMDMVRIGSALFGLRTDRKSYDKIALKPALKVYSSISQIRKVPSCSSIGYDENMILSKDTLVASISIGYADGLPRQYSNIGKVMINGQQSNLISAICMNQCMSDISGLENINVNNSVLVMDSDYNSPCSIKNIAKACNTNQNSIVAGLCDRLPRVYLNE